MSFLRYFCLFFFFFASTKYVLDKINVIRTLLLKIGKVDSLTEWILAFNGTEIGEAP